MNEQKFIKGKEGLMYATQPCKRKHANSNGMGIRVKTYSDKTVCWACICEMPEGPFTHDFGDLPVKESKKQKYFTEEERLAARSRASMRWNAKNKDKTEEYRLKYLSKEEVKVKVKERAAKKYREMDPEKKAEMLAKQRERQRAQYNNLTPEQREIRLQKMRDYSKRKKAEREQNEHERT